MARTRNILTHVRAAKMIAEMTEMRQEIEDKRMTATDVARVLTRRCGFPVTKGNIWGCAEELGIRFLKQIRRKEQEAAAAAAAEKPGVEAAIGSLLLRIEELAKKPGAQDDRINALNNCMTDLVRRLESAEAELFSLYQHLKSMSIDLGRPFPG